MTIERERREMEDERERREREREMKNPSINPPLSFVTHLRPLPIRK
jgi:hypothetical protein